MKNPPEYIFEKERLAALESYSILDSLPEIDYDNITTLAAEICDTPIALITILDDKRQWFKSHYGLEATETPKDIAFCAHAIINPDHIFTVEDARLDDRFKDNPLVTNDPLVIFYSGIPLVTDEGYPLGTLCVVDHKPRKLTEKQQLSLKALSNQVLNLLRLRKLNAQIEQTNLLLQEKNKELENFAFIAAHDLKMPLISISNMGKLVLGLHSTTIDPEGKEMLELINESSGRLLRLVDAVLNYSRCDNLLLENKSTINADELKKEIFSFFVVDKNTRIEISIDCTEINENRAAMDQILINLISNAIKYNDKNLIEIKIHITELDNYYQFIVKDNGPGIDPKYHTKIFEMFEVAAVKDRYGELGNGIGLATVKKLVQHLGGTIGVESEIGKGATFTFTLKK